MKNIYKYNFSFFLTFQPRLWYATCNKLPFCSISVNVPIKKKSVDICLALISPSPYFLVPPSSPILHGVSLPPSGGGLPLGARAAAPAQVSLSTAAVRHRRGSRHRGEGATTDTQPCGESCKGYSTLLPKLLESKDKIPYDRR